MVGGTLVVDRHGETNTDLACVHQWTQQVTVVSDFDMAIGRTHSLSYSTQGRAPEMERAR